MKILRVITRLNVGGPSIQAIDLTRELSKLGHECVLVTGAVPEEEGRFLESTAISTLGCKLRFQLSLKREISKIDIAAFRAARRMIKYHKPDILHTHMSKAGFIYRLAALTLPKKIRPKLVHTFHGHTFHSYFGKCKGWLFLQIERRLSKRTDAVIAISDSQFNEINSYGVRCTHVIPLGFDLSSFLKMFMFDFKNVMQGSDYVDGGLFVGFVGRLAPVKNLKLFVDFVLELDKRIKVAGIYIAGDGPDREELQRLSKFTVTQSWFSNMSRFYRNVDLVVCSSLNEGTPVAIIEAMAAGRLCITTPVGGCVDLINDKVRYTTRKDNRGIHFTRNTMKSDIEFLSMCLEDGSYKNMLKNARSYVEERHSLSQLVANINSLYLSLKGCDYE